MAVTHGHLAVVEYLLEHNANQTQLSDLYSYFFWERNTYYLPAIAVQNGYLPIVQRLLERGADVDGENQCSTPIFKAAMHGHLDMVEFLLEHGAPDKHGLLGLFLQIMKARRRRNHALQSLYGDESERAAFQIIEATREERYLMENIATSPVAVEFLREYGEYNGDDPGALWISFLEILPEILPDPPLYPRLKNFTSPIPVPSCPLIAEIQARERQRILRQRRTALSEIHQRLIDQSSSSAASEAFAAFGEASNSYEDVRKEGVGVMRKLINGHLPHGLHEVVSCLQVADAMRLASSNKKVSTEYICECSQEEYVELTIYDPFSLLFRIFPKADFT